MAGYGKEEGTIEEGEQQLIERAFAFSDLSVSDVMTPRHKVFRLSAQMPIVDAVSQLMASPFSRIPLHDDDPDEIIGILHVRDVLRPLVSGDRKVCLTDLARPPYFVPDRQSSD